MAEEEAAAAAAVVEAVAAAASAAVEKIGTRKFWFPEADEGTSPFIGPSVHGDRVEPSVNARF